jgi:oligopeptide transport system substrate-binding protein
MMDKHWALLESKTPIVELILSQGAHATLTLRYICDATTDVLASSPDILSPRLPSQIVSSSFSAQRLVFSIPHFAGRWFVFAEIAIGIADIEASAKLRGILEHLKQEIVFAVQFPLLANRIAIGRELSKDASTLLRQELVRRVLRKGQRYPQELFDELQHFLLATDQEFKTIRATAHLLRLVSSHYWLRKRQETFKVSETERQLFFRIFPSTLRFQFGTKNVISLVISLRPLAPYERFDHCHILQACKRCVPTLELVPGSFYVYRYAENPTLSLYLELETPRGHLTFSERKLLMRDLGRELAASIEHVVSRIDIPQNEEDIVRSLLLLSQQVKSIKDPPQVIIQFHGQGDLSLDFHVTIVRVVKHEHAEIPHPPPAPAEVSRFLTLRTCIVEKFRHSYDKQGLVFLVQCAKEPFLRHDRSVDFLKARESVLRYIGSVFGKVRDVNGGLIYQQHQLLESVRPLLSQEEAKEQFIIEDLFRSISPTIMKNLLGPEHIVTVFRQFLSLRVAAREKSASTFLVEEYEKEFFIGFVCPPTFLKEEILQAYTRFQLTEHELAMCHVTIEGHLYCFVICLSPDFLIRRALAEWIHNELVERQSRLRSRSGIRVCFSRPTLVLDPRVGTDRISGAVIKMLYEGLMRLDRSGAPSYATAERVEISQDEKKYTFFLRQTYWSNGLPVTAHDFEYAWRKILDPSFHCVFAYLFFVIKNAQQVKEGILPQSSLGVYATSDSQLVVELEAPQPGFLELCCLWIYSPLCREVDKTHPGWAYYADRTYVCNGPFTLAKWRRTSGMQLVKNTRFWDKDNVSLERIDISIIDDPSYALRLFEQGELDWIGEPLSELPLKSIRQKDPRIHTNQLSAVQWFFLNTLKAPFGSKKVRQAFSLALDRQKIVDDFGIGDERISQSILPSTMTFLEQYEPISCDRDKARKLFEEGLLEQGITRSMLRPMRLVVYDQEPHKSIAREVARQWEQTFGISVSIDVVGWHQFFSNMGSGTHDILACMWYSWFRDASYSFNILKDKTNPLNSSKWHFPEFVRLCKAAEQERAGKDRDNFLRQAEIVTIEEMPVIPIFEYKSCYMKSDDIDHVYVSHVGNVDFRWTTINKEKASDEYKADPRGSSSFSSRMHMPSKLFEETPDTSQK